MCVYGHSTPVNAEHSRFKIPGDPAPPVSDAGQKTLQANARTVSQVTASFDGLVVVMSRYLREPPWTRRASQNVLHQELVNSVL